MGFSFKKLFSGINAKIMKTEADRQGLGNNVEIRTDGDEFKTFVKGKNLGNEPKRHGVAKTAKGIMNWFRISKQEAQYDEPPDQVIKGKIVGKEYEDLPEYYEDAIFPATARPNIQSIIKWVREVKLNNMNSTDILKELYGESFDEDDIVKDNTNKIDHLVNAIAYKISRKIWYVGRRPSSMTDSQWNEITKHMRPPEGSYGNNDVWKNFKYDETYQYTSGVM